MLAKRVMYASQLWCNFGKSCMQTLCLAYNFGCRAPYNLPWRASVSNHQVQYNIPTFEALLRKYKYLFLERCRKSNNVWLRALMQSDCLYLSLLCEHYDRILLCDWVIELYSVRLVDGVSSHNAFEFYLDSTNLGISALIRSSAATSVTCWLTIVLRCVCNAMVLSSMQLQKVSVSLWFRRLQCVVLRSVLAVFINLRSAECVCSYHGLRVCSQTNKLKIKLNSIARAHHPNFPQPVSQVH